MLLGDPVKLLVALSGLLFLLMVYLSLLYYRPKKVRGDLPPVSIIVPAYNEEENIGETLRGLLSLDYPVYEIIVVDDGSTDRTYEIASSFVGVRVIRKENGGKASALNRGIREASYDIVACMDADSVPRRDALKNLVSYLGEDVTAVTPALLVYKPSTLTEKFQHPEYILNEMIRRMLDYLDAQYVTPGPLSLFRKKDIEEVGYFREDTIVEDLEMAIRLQKRGKRIVHAPDAVVYTKTPRRPKELLKQRLRWNLGAAEHLFTRDIRGTGNLSTLVVPLMMTGVGGLLLLASILFLEGLENLVTFVNSLLLGWWPVIAFDMSTFLLSFLAVELPSVIALFMLLLTLHLLGRTAHEYGEDIPLDGLLLFIALYFFFSLTVWLLVIGYKLFGGEVKFGGVRWRGGLLRRLMSRS